MAGPDVSTRGKLAAWLKQQPREAAVAVAARAAMRAVPIYIALATKPGEVTQPRPSFFRRTMKRAQTGTAIKVDPALILPLFRASAVASIAAVAPSEGIVAAAAAAAAYADPAAPNAARVTDAAAYAARAAAYADYADYAAATAAYVGYVAYAAATAAEADYAAADCRFVSADTPARLFEQALWPNGLPSGFSEMWAAARSDLLALDAGFDVWIAWYEERLNGKPLDVALETKRALIPEEVWKQEPKAVNAYIAQLAASEELKPLNRVRAIFLGPGDAGKTSLIAALLGEKILEGGKKMTPGVAITDADPDVLWRERAADATHPTVYFWDFGGQVMAHQTHQFFLRSNCVYVIVLEGRRHSEATDAARYWLEHVRAFGEGSPVLIVGNKIDLAPVWVDIQPLARTYAGIVGFFPLSCTEAHDKKKKEFEAFRAALESELVKASASQAMLTESQMQVIGMLRQRAEAEAFLPREEYLTLCRQHGIGTGHKGLDENQLLDILDTLGVIVHFKGLRALDAMLLSPGWLTKGVYTILYSQVAQDRGGRLRFQDVMTALTTKPVLDQKGRALQFDRQRAQFIVDAMCRFKLAYRLPEDEDQIIIPALLGANEPKDHSFDMAKAWSFRFLFEGLMPQHVLPSLIVDRHGDLAHADNPPHDLVWRFGAVLRPSLESYTASAFVEVVENNRTLTISVEGRHGDDYLGVLRDSIRRALAKMPHLVVHEQVALTAEMRVEDEQTPGLARSSESEWAAFRQVQESLKAGAAVYIGPSGVRYSLRKINPRLPAAGSGPMVLAKVDEAVGAQPRPPIPPQGPAPASAAPRHVRVFLSSPGDVKEERDHARELIKTDLPVNEWIRDRLTFDVYSWDDPASSTPLPAHETPQQAIDSGLIRPSQCDVVVVILWSRMGTPLKYDGKDYMSGTHYEFEEALVGALATGGKPMVLLYRRSQKPRIDLDDREFEKKREQYRKVGQFFDRLRNPDGSIRHSAHDYENPEQFRTTLEKHLHHFAKRLLDPPAAQVAPGVRGLVEAARETFRGFDQKPADEKADALRALRQRLDALPEAVVASASDEVKELLAALEQVVPDPTVPL